MGPSGGRVREGSGVVREGIEGSTGKELVTSFGLIAVVVSDVVVARCFENGPVRTDRVLFAGELLIAGKR